MAFPSTEEPMKIRGFISRQQLTRIRLQLAIYFCLHRGSLPENTAGRQPRFGAKPRPKISVKNYMSYEDEGFRGSPRRARVIASTTTLLERGSGLYSLAGTPFPVLPYFERQ